MKRKEEETYNSERIRLITIIVILIALAGIFLLYATWPLLTGKTIMLETKPVDESNIMNNHYLKIDYAINTIPFMDGVTPGQDIYVSLEKNGKGFWGYRSASLNRPNDFFILGRIISIDGKNMNVQYGIEQYFMGNSRLPSRIFQVEVRISRDGIAKIDDIHYMGSPIAIKNLNASS